VTPAPAIAAPPVSLASWLARLATRATLAALGVAFVLRVALDLWPPGPGSPGDWLVQAARETAQGEAEDHIRREVELEARAEHDPAAKAELSALRARNRERSPRSPPVRLAWARELAGRGSHAEARAEALGTFELDPARRDTAEAWTRILLEAGERSAAVQAYRRHRAAFSAIGRDDDSSTVGARFRGTIVARFPLVLVADGAVRTISIAARRAPHWPGTGEIDALELDLADVHELGGLEVLSATWIAVRDLEHPGPVERAELDTAAVRAAVPDGRHVPHDGRLAISIALVPPRPAARTDAFVLELRATKPPLGADAEHALERAFHALGEPWDDR